jgi:predicted nucleotidyltransferase component of viral defense system
MITIETLEKLALQHQTVVFPNIVREYFQHVFLKELYTASDANHMLFKGGTALRILYGSPRFSEDLDFSLLGVSSSHTKIFVESLFVKVLAEIERTGMNVDIGSKSNATTGEYFGVATLRMLEYQPIGIEINVSTRNGKDIQGDVDSVANDFVPTYTVVHLPQHDLVEEKVFGALRDRKKPRDFYDLYFIMRKGMLSPDQKQRLADIQGEVITSAKHVDFRNELGTFLRADQQAIIRDFPRALEAEIGRQIV